MATRQAYSPKVVHYTYFSKKECGGEARLFSFCPLKESVSCRQYDPTQRLLHSVAFFFPPEYSRRVLRALCKVFADFLCT